jgi:CRISPR/Cas system-associated protein Cas10 (large subunit of type III CRISPR-Cas system)
MSFILSTGKGYVLNEYEIFELRDKILDYIKNTKGLELHRANITRIHLENGRLISLNQKELREILRMIAFKFNKFDTENKV